MSSRWMTILQQRQANLSKTEVTCQKCLQKGHWTYECKNERKYVHRTSRSHQLSKHVKQATKRKLQNEEKTAKKHRKSSSGSSSSSASSSSSSSSSSSDSSSDSSSSDSSDSFSSSSEDDSSDGSDSSDSSES
ncbi:uncharacterized protein LOC143459057 [Clavelina lepadiformis]|uniref:uncharacterized protein LOC143459057 n=1 Tax=Clavelina lepadiformis TaxID=159417 RepID=UPI00404202CD